MRVVETTGRTVEEAIAAAAKELGSSADKLVVEILEEPSRGLFGLVGQREAKIRASVRPSKVEAAVAFLRGLAEAGGLGLTVEVRTDEETIAVDVRTSEGASLIGHHGKTLEALQLLTELASGGYGPDRRRIVVDVDGYRARRVERLTDRARQAAQRALRSGREVALEPMTAAERRTVHLAVQAVGGVRTESRGEEGSRHVVIIPQQEPEGTSTGRADD